MVLTKNVLDFRPVGTYLIFYGWSVHMQIRYFVYVDYITSIQLLEVLSMTQIEKLHFSNLHCQTVFYKKPSGDFDFISK